MIELDELYREIILDHYRSPRGKKPVEEANVKSAGSNPSCGDEVEVEARIENNVLKDVHIDCKGCAISTASGSMLAETVKGKSFDEVMAIADKVKKLLKGEIDESEEDLGDLGSLKGVRQFPVRVKCALLAWVTLIEGLKDYANGKGGNSKITVKTDTE